MTGPIVERAAVAKVWPRQVADTTAEYLTPRQIEMLYASANWAHEAADTIEELVEALTDAREAMMKLDGGGMQPADYLNLVLRIDALLTKIGSPTGNDGGTPQ